MTEPTQTASVNGTPVSRSEAIRSAAALLTNSRAPVLAGMGTDIAGARASIRLAQRIGASIDHMDAEAVFANLEVMRRAGWIVTTPLQTRARADTVLLIGDGLLEAWPALTERLALDRPATLTNHPRRVFHLHTSSDPQFASPASPQVAPPVSPQVGSPALPQVMSPAPPRVMAGPGPATHDFPTAALLPTLAALRALIAGRPTSLNPAAAAPLRELATVLTQAKFGVAIWSAATLDALAIELLCGLIDDLNRKTRFAGLPLVPPNGAEGVAQTCTWTTGFPMRTSFAGAQPLHDPWRYDANRLIHSGEADSALWISAFAATPPPWTAAIPTIALIPPGTAFRTPPAVVFEVGHPGQDHDTMLYDQALGGIAFTRAVTPTAIPTVADTVTAITAALTPC
jgi:formylmethanofuran dehydrogenase subunit B